MNVNFKSLLLGTSLSLTPNLIQAQCVATTDCATLGYTETSCPNGKGIKCPFGTTYACPVSEAEFCNKYNFKYACTGTGYKSGSGEACNNKYVSCVCASGYEWKNGRCEKEKTAVLGQCNGYAQDCRVGDILNSDGTCTTDKVSGRTPIGVVVYIAADGDGCGQALALEGIGKHKWALDRLTTAFPGTWRNWENAAMDFDSCGKTQWLVERGRAYYAAYAAYEYAPASAPETTGKWCLPAAGILNSVYTNWGVIDKTLSKIGGEKLSSDYWWSSTPAFTNNVWLMRVNYNKNEPERSSMADTSLYENSFPVRPVIAF